MPCNCHDPTPGDDLDTGDTSDTIDTSEDIRGGFNIGPMRGSSARRPERVVFAPGLMGTSLIDGQLTPDQARALCEKHLGWRDKWLRGTELYPCDKTPEALWGEIGMLHWLYAPDDWGRRMRAGDGHNNPGGMRVGRLVDIKAGKIESRPYAAFVDALRNEGFDLLVFPYDWRMSAYVNAVLLRQAILKKWFGGVQEFPREHRFADDERITFVAHSLGGLVSRALIEGTLRGPELAKRLITIATPHRGVPVSYLYMAGRMHPFGEHSLSRQAQGAIQTRMAEVGPATATAAPDPAAQLLPGGVQTAVVNHMASAFQLLPIYDFVETRKGMEPYADSYRGRKHAGTGMPALQMVQELRAKLQPEGNLGSWLAQHKIDYHFVATLGYSTVSGYHRDKDKVLVTKEGDGTVPLSSAHPLPAGNARVTQLLLHKGRLGHHRMCERPDVLAYVLQVMGRSTTRAATLRRDLTTDELVEAADKILAQAEDKKDPGKKRSIGTVLSVVTLEAQPNDKALLIDITTEPTPEGGRRLVRPPAHLASSDVYTVATTRHSLDYVWISSGADRQFAIGGVLFLPQPDERKVHLVTFNVGRMDQRFQGRCTNVHHAEVQLEQWLLAQTKPWRERLALVDVVNRSRKPRNKGYSPCKACCGDLSGLPASLRNPSRNDPFKAVITWGELYTGMAVCGHPTDKEGLRVLRKGGWTAQGPEPTT